MKHSDQDLLEWVEAGGRACRIHGIGISLACKSFYRETLETSMFVGRSGGIGMMIIF